MDEDDTSQTLTSKPTATDLLRRASGVSGGDEPCDVEAWETLRKSFVEVQTVLDQNRDLIQQVNENHQSKIPDNMAKNVPLIRTINENISKVVGMYSSLSTNFTHIIHQRRAKAEENDRIVE